MKGPQPTPAKDRFFASIVKQDNGCWIYGNNKRYGLIAVEGKAKSAHKFSYELHKGEVPRGLFVCHTCDVKQCVNPDHLYAGTHEDNNQDIVDRGRQAKNSGRVVKTRSPYRYRNGKALSKPHREQMKAEYASGKYTQMQLAARYRISQGTVSATIRNATNMGSGKTGKRHSQNYRRKLSKEQLQEMVKMYGSGMTQVEIAKQFGCTQAHVSRTLIKQQKETVK